MTLNDISAALLDSARRKALANLASKKHSQIVGAAGSSAAVMLCGLPAQADGAPILVVGDSLDDAGYLYFDLCRLVGEEAVAMLPSGFKRDIKYGQADAPNRILRTEALNRVKAGTLRFLVTYPEAMAEGVASREDLDTATIHLAKDRTVDMKELQKWLKEKGFKEVDYVFEPGQFAVRGSIFDIFGYSEELPVRLDFFGDEIDSIRSFNIETQLSEKKLDSVAITADVSGGEGMLSILHFVSPKTLVAMRNEHYTLERVRAVASTEISAFTLLTEEGETDAPASLVDADEFTDKLLSFRRLEFTAAATKPDNGTAATLDFDCSPQGIYHKNFDLISDSFTRFLGEGYRLCILSDNPRQFDRLKAIFADRGDKIDFESIDGTLHEGFVDHHSKICVFTDHQIFDRFHKYTLKSERARSGKLALSLKELGAIEPGDYIVHIDHGVGKFAGLLRTNINGRMQEVIKLVYQNNDILFVSIHSL
ncbi:MAG: transcription-repair coupling factor, partial [Muribaculaceae bacterium]|nr:transcription-repair coupling factor [Muribaculaceae bacterium]